MKDGIGKLFADIRIEKGVSQQKVASEMGLSLTAYRNKEKGRSRFFADEIQTFCKAVGMDSTDIMEQIFLN